MATEDFLNVLRERGFIQATTDDETQEKPLERLLASKRVTAYIGYDPTAPSFHVGNLVAIMGLLHLQRCGHRPVAILGGGTGMVGDPSGKTDMRQVLDGDTIQRNLNAQREQLQRYLDLVPESEAAPTDAQDTSPQDTSPQDTSPQDTSPQDTSPQDTSPQDTSPQDTRGLFLNNADWLLELNYIEFLRDVGRHFSVNRMLTAESVQQRLQAESGLSFLEFNYSLLQAYDFLVLNERYDCELQMGGSDQWGNIVAGIDLIRRVSGRRAHGVTFPLMMTAGGRKMGKTEQGAIWLDPVRTSPYDFYQYWVNTDDRDVSRFLRIFTLLPVDEVGELEKLQGADIRRAKETLALEATALTHGRDDAEKARDGARALFGGGAPGSAGRPGGEAGGGSVPTFEVGLAELEGGIPAVNLFAEAGLCDSRSAARRMAKQNGLYIHGNTIAEDRVITSADLESGSILLRAGKKKYMKILPR